MGTIELLINCDNIIFFHSEGKTYESLMKKIYKVIVQQNIEII